jgi:hypothetical protein
MGTGVSVPEFDYPAQDPPKRAVYSALVGGYEKPREEPTDFGSGIDYLLFTDSDDLKPPPGWNLIKCTPRFANDPVRSARYLKIVGHPILDNYTETLWIDNRVALRGPVSNLFDLVNNYDVAIPSHSFRSDLEAEFSEVIASGYDDPVRVREMFAIAVHCQVQHQRPLWTGIMLRRRNDEVAKCMQRWLELLLLTSRRDQLSINVALADSRLRIKILEFDNASSLYHSWSSHTVMERDKSIQIWRAKRPPVGLRLSDAMRSLPLGRKVARGLTKMGLKIPTLS